MMHISDRWINWRHLRKTGAWVSIFTYDVAFSAFSWKILTTKFYWCLVTVWQFIHNLKVRLTFHMILFVKFCIKKRIPHLGSIFSKKEKHLMIGCAKYQAAVHYLRLKRQRIYEIRFVKGKMPGPYVFSVILSRKMF